MGGACSGVSVSTGALWANLTSMTSAKRLRLADWSDQRCVDGSGSAAQSCGSMPTQVAYQGRGAPLISLRTVQRWANRMLAVLGSGGSDLSLVLCDDATMQRLNRSYRKQDRPTDVLAFAQHEGQTFREEEAERFPQKRRCVPRNRFWEVMRQRPRVCREYRRSAVVPCHRVKPGSQEISQILHISIRRDRSCQQFNRGSLRAFACAEAVAAHFGHREHSDRSIVISEIGGS